MEGTYPLPEAQLDRFLFKLLIDFPSEDEIVEILRRTTSGAEITIGKVTDAETLNQMRQLVPQVIIAEHVERHIIPTCPGYTPGFRGRTGDRQTLCPPRCRDSEWSKR